MSENRTASRAVAVMAKRPAPGKTKTRLTPALTPDHAAGLYEAMLIDTIAMLSRRSDCETVIAVDHPDSAEYFDGLGPHRQILQGDGPLGNRLDTVLSGLLVDVDHAYAINSDGPDLPADHLSEAFAMLDTDDVDVVLGPTEDGGYYLIGWKQRWAPLVTDVQMSTPSVFADTLDIAKRLGARVAVAPPWYDVDVATDLVDLRRRLADSPSATATFLDAAVDLGAIGQ